MMRSLFHFLLVLLPVGQSRKLRSASSIACVFVRFPCKLSGKDSFNVLSNVRQCADSVRGHQLSVFSFSIRK